MTTKIKRSIAVVMALFMTLACLQLAVVPEVYADTVTIDSVRAAIQALSTDPSSYKASDKNSIEAIWADFQSLSASDQNTLDNESHPKTTQSLGRVLEAALWAVWSYEKVDDSTTLPDGTYDANSTPALSYTFSAGKSSSGKAQWSITSVVVKDGKATATIAVNKDTYPKIWRGGSEIGKTNTSGNCEFAGIAIDLNSPLYYAGVSSSMPTPIAYSLTATIEEPKQDDPPDDPPQQANYTAVDAAIASIPTDLSIYTDDTVAAVNSAKNAVVRDKPASEQAAVDAMAKAINDAVAALQLKQDDPQTDVQKTELAVNNIAGMFKVQKAFIENENGKETLLLVFSSKSSYIALYVGTYEQAVANGNNTENWIQQKINGEGEKEFRIPIDSSTSYLPIISISGSYYQKYLDGKGALEDAFFARQFVLDKTKKTLETNDYNETTKFSVVSKIADFKVAYKAPTTIVGGPNSNNYSVQPTLIMKDQTYDKVTYPTVSDDKVITATTALKNSRFTIVMSNSPYSKAFQDKTPIEMKFHVSSNAPYVQAGTFVTRTVTIDKAAKTITITGTALKPKAKTFISIVKKSNVKTIKAGGNKLKKKKTFKVKTKATSGAKTTYKPVTKGKISVSKTGKVTLKKGLKKGKYSIKVKVSVPATKTAFAATKTITIQVVVKK